MLHDNFLHNEHFGLKVHSVSSTLPIMYWMPKMHKNPVGFRFIESSRLDNFRSSAAGDLIIRAENLSSRPWSDRPGNRDRVGVIQSGHLSSLCVTTAIAGFIDWDDHKLFVQLLK